MTFRRSILIILLLVLSVLLVYNAYIAPLFVRGYSQMGMGMHGRMWQSYYDTSSFIDSRIILLLIVIIAIVFLYDILIPGNIPKKCNHCGHLIASERWRICPLCGKAINQRKDDFR